MSSIGKVTTAVNSPSYASTSSSARSTSSSSGSGGSSYTGSAPINYSSTFYNIMGPTLKYNIDNEPYVKYPVFPFKVNEEGRKAIEEAAEKYRNSVPSFPTTGQVHEINYNPNLTVSSVKESDDWWDKTKDVIVNALGLAGDIATVVGVVVMLPEATVAGAVALVGAGILAVADAIFKAFNIGESITGTNIIKEWLGEVQYLTTEDIVETAATIASFGVGVVNVGGLSNIGKMAGKGLKALKNAAGEFIEGFTKKAAKELVESSSDEIAEAVAKIKRNKLPDNESVLGHIFRKASGHIADTPENRALLEEVANNMENFLGTDKYGNEWYTKILEDGRQVWVESRNGNIFDGGINDVPKVWNGDTGLKK